MQRVYVFGMRTSLRAAALLATAVVLGMGAGCGSPTFEPPEFPKHHIEEGGALHADGYEEPFLCGKDGDPITRVACPPERPNDNRASCDSAGCHGGYNYDKPAIPVGFERELFGSDGPSCYTCHGKKWDD